MTLLSLEEYRRQKPHKYRAQPCVIDGIRFPSKRQGARYRELKLAERAGAISNLEIEVTFKLEVNGVLVCRYRADFVYRENGARVVEDTKGFRTPAYKLKKRLMLACHGITVRET